MKKIVLGCIVTGFLAASPMTVAEQGRPIQGSLITIPKLKYEIGVASWYGEEFDGYETANGEVYDMNGLTAAHRQLPFGTKIRVTNLINNRVLVLRVNDRGPYIYWRMLDVSKEAARRLGFIVGGLAPVQIEVLANPKT